MEHREEKSFTINVRLSATFGEQYEGDDDGYAWADRFESVVRPRLIKAVFQALRADPAWHVVAGNRGQSPGDALEVNMKFLTGEGGDAESARGE